MLMPLAIALLLFFSIFMMFLAIAKPKQKEDVQGRLKRLRVEEEAPSFSPHDARPLEAAPKGQGLAQLDARLDELFLPLALKRLGEAEVKQIRALLSNAGRYTMTPVQFRLWQLKAAAGAPLIVAIFDLSLMGFDLVVTPVVTLVAAAAGYFLPFLQLRREATMRRDAILRQLPSTLDLLTICVEAGLSLQAALFKVVEKTRPNPLREEIDQVLREVQLGRPRAEALKAMAKRINLKQVNSVVLSMVQAEAMGTSIGKQLRVQADIAREDRWTRAQEQAFKAPVKLTFPLVFFIFPVVFVVIFGPVALDLLVNFSSGGGTP